MAHGLGGSTQLIDTVRLDDFCAPRKLPPDIIKIDVDGSEHRVIAEAVSAMKGSRAAAVEVVQPR